MNDPLNNQTNPSTKRPVTFVPVEKFLGVTLGILAIMVGWLSNLILNGAQDLNARLDATDIRCAVTSSKVKALEEAMNKITTMDLVYLNTRLDRIAIQIAVVSDKLKTLEKEENVDEVNAMDLVKLQYIETRQSVQDPSLLDPDGKPR